MIDGVATIHPTADVRSTKIGQGTRIWQFVVVADGATIGQDCNICSHCFIESGAIILDRVTLKNGVHVWDGVVLENDVFVGPNVTFTNDKFPRSKVHPEAYSKTVLRQGSSIGANATIIPGISIGKNALVGAGAVVTKSVPEYAIVVGNPARIVGYVGADKQGSDKELNAAPAGPLRSSRVDGVFLIRLKHVEDMRGDLCAAEVNDQLPFVPKRYFAIFDVPSKEVRGEHAHRVCHQFLICTRGSCAVLVDDGAQREEFLLNAPSLGLHIPPMIWGVQYKYSRDAILTVLASEPYDANDYIRTYDAFIAEKRLRK